MKAIIRDQGLPVTLYITDEEGGIVQATSTSLRLACDICDGLQIHKEDITFYNTKGVKAYL